MAGMKPPAHHATARREYEKEQGGSATPVERQLTDEEKKLVAAKAKLIAQLVHPGRMA
jgi:hypothetical protein